MGRIELIRSPSEWPPAEVWDEVDRAARVWEDLRAQGLELRFAPGAGGGRVEVSLCDLDGNVLRALSPAEAIAVASGE